MKKRKHEKEKIRKFEAYSVLILIATLFMCIGYAEITSQELTITGKVSSVAQKDVFITDVKYVSNTQADTANSKINYYLGTMLDSQVVLGSTRSSSITYNITVYNSTDKEQLFIDTLVDSTIPNSYTNQNIKFDLTGIEKGVTTIPPKESLTFSITFTYKENASTTNKTLKSILNFRFLEKPTLVLSNENEKYTLTGIYPDYTPKEYQFTVSNYTGSVINGVPMTYYFETQIESPLSVKIYNEDGNEVGDSITIDGDGNFKTSHTYTLKVIWDNSLPVEELDYNSIENANKKFNCTVNLKAVPSGANSDKYSEYIENKQFVIDITTAPFYFETIIDSNSKELNNTAEFKLTVKNNNQVNYNTFDTTYNISLSGNNKFKLYVDDQEASGATKVIAGSKLVNNEVNLKLVPKEGVGISAEEKCEIIIKSKSPYAKSMSHTVTITDKTKPQITLTASTTDWTNQDVTLTGTSQDTGSGIVAYAWTDTNVTPTNWNNMQSTTSQTTQTIKLSSNGTKYFWTKDNVGNTNVKSIEITKIDKVAPSTPTIKIMDISITAARWQYTISASEATDDYSGIKDYEYLLGSSASTSTATTKSLNGTNNPNYNIKVRVRDNAGNYSEYSEVIVMNIKRLFIRQLYQELRENGKRKRIRS